MPPLTAVGGTLTTVGGALAESATTPTFPTLTDFVYARGVNVAGGEFNQSAAAMPGTFGSDYDYSTLSYMQALRARGHRIIRIPFRWERVQPTLSGPLDPAGVGHLRDALENAREAGLMVLLDMHNYCRFYRADDVQVVFGNGISQTDFTDAWTRLVQEFADEPAIVAWGLMNEPNNLPVMPAVYTPDTTMFDFAVDALGWSVNSGTGTLVPVFPGGTSVQAYQASRVTAANSGNFTSTVRAQIDIRQTSLAPSGAITVEVYVPASTPGTQFEARLSLQNTSFAEPAPGTYFPVPKGHATTITYTTPTGLDALNHRSLIVQLAVDGSDGTTPTVFQIGRVAGDIPAVPSTYWKVYSQAAVTAIRAASDTRAIFVAGENWGGADGWATKNGNPWITDPAGNTWYEAHYYFSQGYNAGTFTTYADDEADAVTNKGHANLTDRVTTELGQYLTWLSGHGVRGFIGEIGWPADADAASWNAIGDTCYRLLDAAGVGATAWTSGTKWSPGVPLNVYEGDPPTVKAQATVLEAHPSRPAGQ